jgi:protocatechuate 3,4-dioxygenase, beta subunit
MYLPEDGEANARDRLYRSLGDSAPTSVAAAMADHRYAWDIVILEG